MSAILTQTQLLLSAVAVNTDQLGATYEVLPPSGASPTATSLRLLCRITQSGGATSPTSELLIEQSMDNLNWAQMSINMALNADGEKGALVEIEAITRYVRIRLDLGGGTLPTVTARCELAADGPVRLTPVS